MHVELFGVFLDSLAKRSEIDGRFFDGSWEIAGAEKLVMLTSNNSFVEEVLGLDNLTLTCADEEGERHHLFEKVVSFSITSDCGLEDDRFEAKREILGVFHNKFLLKKLNCPFLTGTIII
jgi:hypothetical protein